MRGWTWKAGVLACMISASVCAQEAPYKVPGSSATMAADHESPGDPFDWQTAFPLADDPELVINIPFVFNGNIPIKRSTEMHFNMMKKLQAVETALYMYYDAKYAGAHGAPLITLRNNVMRELGRAVTTMDGYARHFKSDISPYMKDLQSLVKRYQNFS